MFCENCGKQIPDGSAFCEHCGAKVETAAAPAAQAAPVATAAAPAAKKSVTFASLMEKVKAIHKKNKFIFPAIGAVAVIAIALIIVFSILGKQVSLKNYLEVTVEGYNGYGQIDVEFGDMSFGMRAAGDKDSKEYGDHDDDDWFTSLESSEVSKDCRKNLKKAQKLVDSIAVSYEYPEGKAAGSLSNGDVITFTIEFDEDLAKDLGLTIQDATFEYTVEGLKAITQFDVLSYFDLTVDGYDGYGNVKLLCNQTTTKQAGNITFTMETGADRIRWEDKDGYTGSLWVYMDTNTYNRSNGDVIKGSLDVSADYFVSEGVELIGLEKEYTVSGLKETTAVDLLQYYEVTLTGINGSGKAEITPKQETVTINEYEIDLKSGEWWKGDERVATTRVYLNDSWGLTNDDVIEIYFNFSESTFAEMGIKFPESKKEITVSGLAAYATALSEIKDYSAQEAAAKQVVMDYLNDNWSRAVHDSYFGSYSNQTIGEDMKLHKMVLTTPKSTTSSTKNTLWMIFSVTLSDNKITTPTVYYFAVTQSNVAVYADGTLYSGDSYYKYTGRTSYEAVYTDLIESYNLNIDVSE